MALSAPQTNFNLALPFYRHALETPARPALVVDGRSYSYADLAARVHSIITWLAENLPAEPCNIGILADRSLEAYTGLLAVCWAGHTYVPLKTKLPPAHLRTLIGRSDIAGLIVDAAGQQLLSGGTLGRFSRPVLKPDFPAPEPERQLHPASLDDPAPVAANDFAYINFTSGSTGTPKGIAATAGNVFHFLRATQHRYRLDASDRFSQFNDLIWDPSVFDLFAAWGVGASVHVVPSNQLLAPADFILEHQLTVWYSAPVQIGLMKKLRRLTPGAFPSLRLSLFVGEALLRSAAEDWQAAAPNSLVENVYGPTETTVVCLGQPFTGSSECLTPERDFVAIGTPYEGMHVEILDETRKVLPPDKIGEIAISGPQVTPGYYKQPELTEKSFVMLEHPSIGTSRWYLTGDIGYRSREGIFHFLGRNDQQVQIHGFRVELGEVECHLRTVSGCRDVAVFPWPVNQGIVLGLAAVLNVRPEQVNRIRADLKDQVPPYMVPARFIALPELPRTANGKIDRKRLAALIGETG